VIRARALVGLHGETGLEIGIAGRRGVLRYEGRKAMTGGSLRLRGGNGVGGDHCERSDNAREQSHPTSHCKSPNCGRV
jgi:hypothetical protein